MNNQSNIINNTIDNKNNSFLSNGKWTLDGELKLIKLISSGNSIDYIAKTQNMNSSDIEKRLQKIIFENIIKGKSITVLSNGLKLPEEKIRSYFDSYKQYREKYKGLNDLENLNNNSNNIIPETNIQNGGYIMHVPIKKDGDKEHKLIRKMDKKIDTLKYENQLLTTIIENKELHKKLNKMVKDGSVDKNVKLLIKEVMKKKNKK